MNETFLKNLMLNSLLILNSCWGSVVNKHGQLQRTTKKINSERLVGQEKLY